MVNLLFNVFLATLQSYESLGLRIQLDFEDVTDSKVCQILAHIHIFVYLSYLRLLQLPANFSFCDGSKGALLNYGVLWFFVHYDADLS